MASELSAAQLRPFTDTDAGAIVTWPASLVEAQWWAGPQIHWPLVPARVRHWHTDPDVRPYVLHDGDTPIAYGELWVDAAEQEVELARLIVAPSYRGQGVGASLVRLLLAEARRTPYPQVFLRVSRENHRAIACYLQVGFAPVSPPEQLAYNRNQPVNYLWMRYTIPA